MWHALPAQTVREVITAHCKQFPPTQEQLKDLIKEYDYIIVDVPLRHMRTARTDHLERLVYLPSPLLPEQMPMLLHETAEVLLRLPVAPEFHFVPSWRDEHHEVACLVERGLK